MTLIGVAQLSLERLLCISSSNRRDTATVCQRWACTIEASYFGIVTSLTVLTNLLASTKLLSGVTEVLRTMLPPPGIAQLWNFSVLGSKRTTVFGLASDSLYQMTSWIAEMP